MIINSEGACSLKFVEQSQDPLWPLTMKQCYVPPAGVKFVYGQFERAPVTAQLYLTVYIEFDNEVSKEEILSNDDIFEQGHRCVHCTPARGTREEFKLYCTKADKRAAGSLDQVQFVYERPDVCVSNKLVC